MSEKYKFENPKVEYLVMSHLGNVRASVDATGNVLQRDDYYPFGLTFNSYVQGAENNFKFQNHEEQKETGTFSYLFREYDPALGRWWQLDPLYKFHESQYAYVTNNPILYFDILGLDADTLNSNAPGFDWDVVVPGDVVDGAIVLEEVTKTGNREKGSGFQTFFIGSGRAFHNSPNKYDRTLPLLVIDMTFLIGSWRCICDQPCHLKETQIRN